MEWRRHLHPPGRDSITDPRAAGINRRSIMIEKRAHTAREGRRSERRSEWEMKRKQQQQQPLWWKPDWNDLISFQYLSLRHEKLHHWFIFLFFIFRLFRNCFYIFSIFLSSLLPPRARWRRRRETFCHIVPHSLLSFGEAVCRDLKEKLWFFFHCLDYRQPPFFWKKATLLSHVFHTNPLPRKPIFDKKGKFFFSCTISFLFIFILSPFLFLSCVVYFMWRKNSFFFFTRRCGGGRLETDSGGTGCVWELMNER